MTGARLCVCSLHWQAVIERNGNGLQKSSKGGNWFSAQAQWSPAGVIWDGPYFGGTVWGRGCLKPSSRDPWLFGEEGIALCESCSRFLHLWRVGSSFAWWPELGVAFRRCFRLARKYATEWCVYWARPFGVERQTGRRFLAMVSELWLWLISYSIVSHHLDIGKALPGPSQGLDPYVWTPSHPYLVSGSSETLQTSCCLQSTNDFYWDLTLTGHCIKARAETGTDCLFQTEIGARLWKEG